MKRQITQLSLRLNHKVSAQPLAGLLVRTPVAVEKLASEKSAKIKTPQEAPQTIFSSRVGIFYLPISAYLEKKGLFQQRRLLSPTMRVPASRHSEDAIGIQMILSFRRRLAEQFERLVCEREAAQSIDETAVEVGLPAPG